MEEFELVVAEQYKSENGTKQKKEHFLEFSDCQDNEARYTIRRFSNRKPL